MKKLLLILALISPGAYCNDADMTYIISFLDELPNRYYVLKGVDTLKGVPKSQRDFYLNLKNVDQFMGDLNQDIDELENIEKIISEKYRDLSYEKIMDKGCEFGRISARASSYLIAFERINQCILDKCRDIDFLIDGMSMRILDGAEVVTQCKNVLPGFN